MKITNQLILLLYVVVSSTCCIFVSHSKNSTATFSCLPHQNSVLLKLKQEFTFKKPEMSYFVSVSDAGDSILLNSNSEISYPKMRNWKAGSDCCYWDGVTCNMATGHVTSLDLSNSWLSGPLRPNSTLFSLLHLQKLNLAFNDFTMSPIPSEFGRLSRLTHLNLSLSMFSGYIPSEISWLTNLISLDLSGEFGLYLREREQLGRLIRNMTNLKQLHLDSVNLSSSSVPQSMANLSFLTHLSLHSCALHGQFPENIFQLPSIQSIDLSENNGLEWTLPEFLSSSNLKSLVLYSTNFSGKWLDSIGNLKSLNVLNLGDCLLSGTVPSLLWNLSELVDLDLSKNYFTGQLPSTLRNLAKLTSLKLEDNKFSGEFPSSLKNLPQLKYVHLGKNNFSGQISSSLGNLTQLTHLDLSNNFFIGKFPNPMAIPYLIEDMNLGYNNLTGSIPSDNLNLTFLGSLDLSDNFFSGVIPSSLFTLPSLQRLYLDHNEFSNLLIIPKISNSTQLEALFLDANELCGLIPKSISKLKKLRQLGLNSNNLSGVDWSIFSELSVLESLDLSYNSRLSEININANSTLPKFQVLYLSSCNISEFPHILKTQDELWSLDLSSNRIDSSIPKWFLSMGTKTLYELNLSHNFISGWEEVPLILPWKALGRLDLHSNMLQGPLVVPSMTIEQFFISNNSLTGSIHPLFCKLSNLRVLDVSSNRLGGTIPQCLGNFDSSLDTLNLRFNNFKGNIPQICRGKGQLMILDLSHNQFHGKIPRSLIKCKDLLVLNLGHNQISDTFPFWLQNLPHLWVLILSSNKFHGHIWHTDHNFFGFEQLRIIDLSHNDFIGSIPSGYFSNWTSMIAEVFNKTKSEQWKGAAFTVTSVYQLLSVSMMNKGQEMEVVRLLDLFISIDLSDNKFHGEIPSTIWDLQSLVMLNLSNNSFSGFIPSSLGNLKQLQSLDLSNNKLSGKIPQQLTSLTFLAYLNLSQNELVGPIPQGGQVWTFENSSFEGNLGLCDFPLSRKCGTPPSTSSTSDNHYNEESYSIFDFGWKVVAVGYGCGVLVGLVAGHVITSRRPNLISRIYGVRLQRRRR